jgi:hypothetical protein
MEMGGGGRRRGCEESESGWLACLLYRVPEFACIYYPRDPAAAAAA